MSKPIVATVALVVLLSTLAGVAVGAPETGSRVETGALAADALGQQTPAAERSLQSGEPYWRGEQLVFDASGILSSDANEADRTFELWRVTADGQLNQQVRTFVVASNGTHTLDTGDLVGRYAVRYGEQIVYVHDGVGYLESPPDGSDVTADSAAFDFTRQTLSFSWSDPSVYPGQRVTLTLTSNRNEYTAAVSGGNLSFSDLETVFPNSMFAENHDARADENVLLVRAGASTTVDLETAALEPGRGDLEFDVVDTATAETTDLTVKTPANESHFVSVERRENVGDVVEMNLSCSHCFLVAGGPGESLLDVVEITDTNGDGYVTLRMNTRYAGMNPGTRGYPSNVQAYTSPHDSVRRYSAGSTLETLDEELVYSNTELSDQRSILGHNPTGRRSPAGPGEIKLTLAATDFVVDRSAWGNREPLGSQMVVRDETDVRTLTLEPRGLSGVETLGAPGGAQFPANVGAVSSTAGPRDSVALGDHLVFRFDVSGLGGYLDTNGASVATVENNRDEGIYLTLEGISDEGPTAHPLEQTAARVYFDPATDSLYLVVKTGGTSQSNLQTGQFRARLRLEGVSGQHADYSTIDAYDGYPHLEPGATDQVSATATVEPPKAAIVDPEEGSSPHMNANESLVVSGTTSLAPGGSVRLEASSTEYAWDTSATATVNETGGWTGALNLTEAPGDEFTVALFHEETQFDERTYTVRPPLENASGEGGSSGGKSSSGGSGGPVGAIAGGGLLSTLVGLAVPIGGGLGALVVVWVLWRLVIRKLLL